jgi:uncharacterized protein
MALTESLWPESFRVLGWLGLLFLGWRWWQSGDWRKLGDSSRLNLFLAATVALLVLWQIKTGIRTGLSFHLYGIAVLTMMFGFWRACFAGVLILLANALFGRGSLATLGLDAMLVVVLPAAVSWGFYLLLDRVDGLVGVFDNAAEESRFMALFQRRWNEISRALDAPVENLADPRALAPLIMDWDGLLGDLPPADAARLKAEGIPLHAQLWANGFLLAVEYWESDWTLPQGSKDEAFVDEKLEPFYVLMAPEDELSPEERETSRTDHLALAIWGAYDLHEFWRDRGRATQKTN